MQSDASHPSFRPPLPITTLPLRITKNDGPGPLSGRPLAPCELDLSYTIHHLTWYRTMSCLFGVWFHTQLATLSFCATSRGLRPPVSTNSSQSSLNTSFMKMESGQPPPCRTVKSPSSPAVPSCCCACMVLSSALSSAMNWQPSIATSVTTTTLPSSLRLTTALENQGQVETFKSSHGRLCVTDSRSKAYCSPSSFRAGNARISIGSVSTMTTRSSSVVTTICT